MDIAGALALFKNDEGSKIPTPELLLLHLRCHQLYNRVLDKNIRHSVTMLHGYIAEELKRRKLEHESPLGRGE